MRAATTLYRKKPAVCWIAVLLYKVPVNNNISTLVPQPSPWRINDLYFRFIVLVNEIRFFFPFWKIDVGVCSRAVGGLQFLKDAETVPRNRFEEKPVETIIQNWVVCTVIEHHLQPPSA